MQTLKISPLYRQPIGIALGMQTLIGVFASLLLDGGMIAQLCGISLVAFWGGTATLIARRPHNPTQVDISLIRVGYLAAIMLTFFVAPYVWRLRGF